MYCDFRFLVFGYDSFYPEGGFDDFLFGFNEINEFEQKVVEFIKHREHLYVVDLSTFINTCISNYENCIDIDKIKCLVDNVLKEVF